MHSCAARRQQGKRWADPAPTSVLIKRRDNARISGFARLICSAIRLHSVMESRPREYMHASSKILALTIFPMMLLGCQTQTILGKEDTGESIADTRSDGADNVENDRYLRQYWTSDSFILLRKSRLSSPVQRVQLLLFMLPMIHSESQCSRSEIIEIKPIRADKERWTVRVCDKVKESDFAVSSKDTPPTPKQ